MRRVDCRDELAVWRLTVWRVGCVTSWPNEFDAVKTYTTEYWRSPVSRVHVLHIWLGLIMTAIVVVYVWSWLSSHCATPSMGEASISSAKLGLLTYATALNMRLTSKLPETKVLWMSRPNCEWVDRLCYVMARLDVIFMAYALHI